MSLYDDATFIFSAEAAAGLPGRAHALKPVEKLKDTELITDTDFDDSNEWTTGTGWSISGGKAVADGTGSGTGADLKNTTADLSGKTVKISFEISDYEQGNVRIYFHGANSTAESSAFSGNGIHTFTHVVTSGHNSSTGPRSFDSFKGKIDNFSIKEVEVRSLDYEVIRDSNLTATRVKADGYIEKGRENLIIHSNDFSEWGVNTDVYNTPTTGYSGYDGSTNAWLIDRIATDNSYVAIPNNPLLSYSGVFTWSIYAKNESGTDNGFLMYTEVGQARFDLTGDGAVLNDASGTGTLIHSNIEKIGSSGWFRCSFTASGTINANSNGRPRFRVEDLSNNNAIGKIYVQNSQIEAGLVATPYIDSKEVTGEAGVLANEPRYDYLTSTDDCPGALIEPERTNKLEYSEYFSGWPTKSNVTLTDNDAKSPEGLNNATKLLASGSGTVNHQVDSNSFGITSGGGSVTGSIFAKKGNTDFVRLRLNGTTSGSNTGSRAWFDLENGSVGSVDADATATITDMGDGWYRCTITEAGNTNDNGLRLQVFINESDGQTSWTADGDEYIYIYGAQFEEGPWDTSYIPTHGSSETRENDTYRTPVDTSGVYAQDDFTVFIDYKDFKTHGTDSAGLWRFIHRNVTTKSVFQYNKSIGYTGENHHQYEYASNQATEGANKIAVVYNRDSFKVYLNGAENKADYTVNTDMLGIARSELRYGKSKMTVNRVMVFDRPLTKDEAIALTT